MSRQKFVERMRKLQQRVNESNSAAAGEISDMVDILIEETEDGSRGESEPGSPTSDHKGGDSSDSSK